MFDKILIANRGEIAIRIIRACREMNIRTVAVFSEIDREALHTQLADEAICIGPAKASESYLDMKRIISATIATKANAIHPGFGFLAENPRLAKICEESNIIFIGPKSNMIEAMGDKARARETMKNAGINVIPGSDGRLKNLEEAKRVAKEMGYPIIVKASAGGGGKGMRAAYNEEELKVSFQVAQQEAKASFHDDGMYMEKLILNPKHIEFQILADQYGKVLHLGERDCSIQRNHQKVLEEAPSPVIEEGLRRRMGETAVRAAKAIGYENAGTIEFLLTEKGEFYFMEMNTRIQVEHPITEMVTGIDIIKKQIEIAAGVPLALNQEDIEVRGHAIECRINAENPAKGFRPSPGTIENLIIPGGKGIRVDSGIYPGYKIPPNYDSMIAKLISYGENREEAIAKMRSALGEFVIEGVDTNIEYQYELLRNADFLSGKYHTGFIDK